MAVLSDDKIRLKNINHITYNVKDKDAALKWYQEILGLKQIPKMVNSDNLYWLQLPSGAMVHIIQNPDAPSAPSHHTAFEVDDIEAARNAVMGAGVEVTEIQTRNDMRVPPRHRIVQTPYPVDRRHSFAPDARREAKRRAVRHVATDAM